MPLAVWAIIRILRALRTTFQLLVDVKLLRALPWAYIRRLPLRHAWIGVITLTLAISLTFALAALAVPGDTGRAMAEIGWLAALSGVVSSWIRALVQRRQLRR